MKNYISIAALLAAGTLVSNAASVIYAGAPDGVEPTYSDEYTVEYSLASSGDYQNLKIQAVSDDPNVDVRVSNSTVSGVTIENNKNGGLIQLELTDSTLSGKVVSSTTGSGSSGNWILMAGNMTFQTGTSFELKGSSDVLFLYSDTITWNLSADDVNSAKALVSVADESSSVYIDSAASIVLNFVDEEAIKAAAKSETFRLFEEGTTLNGASASKFSIQLDGAVTAGYDLSVDVSTGKVSVTAVPEPSAFGLLAGVGALALVAFRRRRTKRA